jgi:hypothetical protein
VLDGRCINLHHFPDDFEINVVVTVDASVAHPGDLPPLDLGMFLPELLGEPFRRLAQDDNPLYDCGLDEIILQKLFARQARGESLDIHRGQQNVCGNGVIPPHTRAAQ